MLAYILALAVALGSFALYMAAFFFPEIHRRNDLIWSGVGLFYALVLWVCAGRVTGGLLLGQTASVALLGWLGWQTVSLRRQMVPPDQQTALPTVEEVQTLLSNWFSPENLAQVRGQLGEQAIGLRNWAQATWTATIEARKKNVQPPVEEPYVPLTPADFASARSAAQDQGTTEKTVIPTAGETIDEEESEAREDLPSIEPPVQSRPAPVPDRRTRPPVTPSPGTQSRRKPLDSPTVPERLGSAFAAISAAVQSTLSGVTRKPESKPVYVRKQYRKDAEEDAAIDLDGDEFEFDAEDTEETEAGVVMEATLVDPTMEDLEDSTQEASIDRSEPIPTPETVLTPETPAVSEGAIDPQTEAAVEAVLEEAGDLTAEDFSHEPVEDSLLPADAVIQEEIAYEEEASAPDVALESLSDVKPGTEAHLEPMSADVPASEGVEARMEDGADPPLSTAADSSPEEASDQSQDSEQQQSES